MARETKSKRRRVMGKVMSQSEHEKHNRTHYPGTSAPETAAERDRLKEDNAALLTACKKAFDMLDNYRYLNPHVPLDIGAGVVVASVYDLLNEAIAIAKAKGEEGA